MLLMSEHNSFACVDVRALGNGSLTARESDAHISRQSLDHFVYAISSFDSFAE